MSMIKPVGLTMIVLILSSTTLGGCAADRSRAGYVPPEALIGPSGQVSDAIVAFASKVQSETLAGYRREARTDMMRGAIRDYFEGDNATEEAFNALMPGPKDLLCKPRYGYLRIAAPIQNTNAKASSIKDLLKPPSDDVKTLVQNLGKKYTIDGSDSEVSASYDAWQASKGGKACVDAAIGADPFATRDYIGREFALAAAIPAAKALFDSVWGIVKPAIVGALQNADLERRNAAIREYFSSPENVNALTADIKHVESFLESEFALDQRRTAGFAVAAQAMALDPKSSAWTNARAAAAKDGCAQAIRRLASAKSKTDPQGVVCLGAVYEALNPAISSALDAADKFDVSIEKQLPKEHLSDQIGVLSEIAQGKAPPEDRIRALWGSLLRYATLYNTVKDTASDANAKKFEDAVAAFRKALQ